MSGVVIDTTKQDILTYIDYKEFDYGMLAYALGCDGFGIQLEYFLRSCRCSCNCNCYYKITIYDIESGDIAAVGESDSNYDATVDAMRKMFKDGRVEL